MDKLAEEILNRVHNIERMSAEMDDSYVLKRTALRAMQEFAKQNLRNELIRCCQQFYTNEETCIYYVDEYLKQRK
jgi:hypothetical protein